jgi:probable phosphoglycerate mutase
VIYFIRHGESETNVKHVFAGRNNSALTEKGREQAKDGGYKIMELGFVVDTIISSPLVRAFDTAKIVADIIGYNKEIIIDDRIIEYDMGSLTGTPLHNISSKMLINAKNSENTKDFANRVRSFLNDWSKTNEDILIVSHAGVGRIIESMRQNGDLELFYDLPAYPNASVIKLD